MLDAVAKALGGFGDRDFRRVVWRMLGASLLLCVLIALGAFLLLALTRSVDLGWLDAALDLLGALATIVLVMLLFPAVAGLVAGLFLEQIASAVERRHYPGAPPPRRQTTGEALAVGLRFMLALAALNLLALPVYVFVPGLNLLLFYALNGALLGREYFEFAALRRHPPAEARALRRSRRGAVWLGGVLLALLASVPVANLLLPVLGAAAFVHLVARRAGAPA